jgi:hypothetical protein
MSKEELVNIIESETSWTLAKHRSASHLLDNFYSDETLDYIWGLFIKTGDYYYCSIIKENKRDEQ